MLLGSPVLILAQMGQPGTTPAFAADSLTQPLRKLDETEVNFLFSYYTQDGNNSPVTGGIGTEQLTDISPKVIINVPLNEKTRLNIDAGLDSYSSASTDNIDRYVSSASSKDTRVHANAGVTRTHKEKGITYSLRGGGSNEYDYTSLQIGGSFAKTSKNGNRELGISAQAFFDNWELIYPEELRGKGQLVSTSKRRSYNLALTYSQVITRRLQLSITGEMVYQEGLLSTPFHRVYVAGETLARVELLPAGRLKIPIGIRMNYYLSDKLLVRGYYRYYQDDWGVVAHTVNIELPVKINRFFSVYPFYRYHTQTAADYFKAYGEHTATEAYYTSDYDLSELDSHQYGAGMRISPAAGIAAWKRPFKPGTILLKGIELRYSHYTRSTGLGADIVSVGFTFTY
jgi:hypothetical protein